MNQYLKKTVISILIWHVIWTPRRSNSLSTNMLYLKNINFKLLIDVNDELKTSNTTKCSKINMCIRYFYRIPHLICYRHKYVYSKDLIFTKMHIVDIVQRMCRPDNHDDNRTTNFILYTSKKHTSSLSMHAIRQRCDAAFAIRHSTVMHIHACCSGRCVWNALCARL